MSKLIDAVTAAERIEEVYGIGISDLVDTFADIPASDAVEVVRCKNCRYFDYNHGNSLCWLHCESDSDSPVCVDDEDYCSCGAILFEQLHHEKNKENQDERKQTL